MNFVEAQGRRQDGVARPRRWPWRHLPLPGRDLALPDGAPVAVGIRPEHAEIGGGPLKVERRGTEMLGSETIIHARLASGERFTLAQRGISGAKPGEDVPLALPPAFVHLFDDKGIAVGAAPDWRRDYVR